LAKRFFQVVAGEKASLVPNEGGEIEAGHEDRLKEE
jgi:hypothetical protein